MTGTGSDVEADGPAHSRTSQRPQGQPSAIVPASDVNLTSARDLRKASGVSHSPSGTSLASQTATRDNAGTPTPSTGAASQDAASRGAMTSPAPSTSSVLDSLAKDLPKPSNVNFNTTAASNKSGAASLKSASSSGYRSVRCVRLHVKVHSTQRRESCTTPTNCKR